MTDNSPLQGVSYYRIQQTDLDGAKTYSEVKTITINHSNYLISIYPNPAKNSATITSKEAIREVKIFDVAGRVIALQTCNANILNLPLNIKKHTSE